MMKNLTNEELCILAKAGNRDAKELLIQNNDGFIKDLALKYDAKLHFGSSTLIIDENDLIQEGRIALVRSIDSYDESTQLKFLTYAGTAIKHAMNDCVTEAFSSYEERMTDVKEDLQYTRISLNRYTRTEELIMSADSIASITTMQPEKHLFRKEKIWEFYHALNTISEREFCYLNYRFGIEDGEEKPQNQAAKYFGLSLSRAKALEELAIDNLWLELPWWYYPYRGANESGFMKKI